MRSPTRCTAGIVAALIGAAVLGAHAASAEAEATKEAPGLSADELAALRDKGAAPVVIDVRSAEEYAGGHIPGAVNIPHEVVAERIAEIDAPNGVVLYCMVGPRARRAEAALFEAGYTSVFHLEGGLAAWQTRGLPVEPEREPER